MSNGHSLFGELGGKGVAVVVGVISLILTFVPGTGIPFLGRIGLFALGIFLILLGTDKI